jgi:Domain of unknown function (DUF4455)
MAQLRLDEEGLEASAQRLYADLQAECATYKGYSGEELASLLETECAATVTVRRKATHALLQQTDAWLKHEARRWRSAAERLSAFWVACAQAVAHHDADGKAAEKAVRKELKGMQRDAEQAEATREAALADALAELRHAHSEADLAEKVAVALERLGDIEAGYRGTCTAMVDRAAVHPDAVQRLHDACHVSICALLHLKPHVAAPAAADGAAAAEGADAGLASLAPVRVPPLDWARTADLLQAVLEPAAAAERAAAEQAAECAAQSLQGSPADAKRAPPSRQGTPADAKRAQPGRQATPPAAAPEEVEAPPPRAPHTVSSVRPEHLPCCMHMPSEQIHPDCNDFSSLRLEQLCVRRCQQTAAVNHSLIVPSCRAPSCKTRSPRSRPPSSATWLRRTRARPPTRASGRCRAGPRSPRSSTAS